MGKVKETDTIIMAFIFFIVIITMTRMTAGQMGIRTHITEGKGSAIKTQRKTNK
jgi:hypothetical protein